MYFDRYDIKYWMKIIKNKHKCKKKIKVPQAGVIFPKSQTKTPSGLFNFWVEEIFPRFVLGW